MHGADQHNTPGTAAEVRPYIEDNYGLVGYSDASWRSKLNDYSSYSAHAEFPTLTRVASPPPRDGG